MANGVRDIDKVTTIKGASEFTGASKGALMNAIITDKVIARKDGGTWLLDVASVIHWNKNRKVNQPNG